MPRAFVVRQPDAKSQQVTKEDVANFVKDKVVRYKRLTGGVDWIEVIPKNPSGKVSAPRPAYSVSLWRFPELHLPRVSVSDTNYLPCVLSCSLTTSTDFEEAAERHVQGERRTSEAVAVMGHSEPMDICFKS